MTADNQPEFDAFAENYDQALEQGISVSGESKDFFAQERVRWLAGMLVKRGHAVRRILDFGCGTGSATPFLRECFPEAEIVGTDISESSIRVARRDRGGSGIEYGVYPAYRPTAPFDAAYCNGVFHHIPLDQRDAAVRYVFDALRPGGVFGLWENNPWNPGTRYVMSRIPFDRDAITLSPPNTRSLLRRNGFTVHRTDALFIFPRALGALRFVEPWVSRLPLGAQYQVFAQRPA